MPHNWLFPTLIRFSSYTRMAVNKCAPAVFGAQRRSDAVRRSKHGTKMKWCHILADWLPADSVKAAHLVPKLLESEELSYFFGVGAAVPGLACATRELTATRGLKTTIRERSTF
jgi:hypothetical protein